MPIFLAILIVIALLLTAAVGVMSFNFHSSDAAGNGLAVVFILFFTSILFALMALILIIVTIRAPHASLPADVAIWRKFAGAAFVLFIIAAGSQLAAVRVLSDRGTSGSYALALQLTFFITPLAFLLYSAWRTFGLAAISPGVVAVVCASAIVAGSILPWPGLVRLQTRSQARAAAAARAPTVETLRYPAVLIWNGVSLQVIDSAADLEQMHTNRVLHRDEDPVLLDAVFRAFTLKGLKMRESGLTTMVTGPGVKPVEFTLEAADLPVKSQTARDLILGCKYLDPDPEKDAAIRQRIARTETLENMIAELRGGE